MKNDDGSIYRGVVWPGATAFPDWFNSKTQAYWNGQFGSFFNASTGVDIDALWIDMNEPANFCEYHCNVPEDFVLGAEWIDSINTANFTGPPRPTVKLSTEPHRPVSESLIGQPKGKKMGLPGRDLINPKYLIQNNGGSISSHTIPTDLIHANGLAEYDTHNL